MIFRTKVSLLCATALCAAQAEAGTLFAIQNDEHLLVTIDRTTHAVTPVGALGIPGRFGDLTYDSANHTLYAVGGRDDNNLYTVSQTTGAATLVGSHGITDLFSLAYDGSTNTLYGQSAVGNVYTISLGTGAATLIGANGVYPGGYAYNSTTNQLLLVGAGSSGIYEIDRGNGAATLLASIGFYNDNGVTWDPEFNGYWVDDVARRLHFINASFTSSTIVANLATAYDGIAWVPDAGTPLPVPEPAGLSLLGLGLAGLLKSRRR